MPRRSRASHRCARRAIPIPVAGKAGPARGLKAEQSVNEELETINAELSRQVEELAAVNGDLQNVFQSIPALLLDGDLRIKRFSQAAIEIFRLIESDVGRPVTEIAPRFAGDIETELNEALRTFAVTERQVSLPDGTASYLMRVLPYRRVDNVIDGLVLTFLDVTQLDRALEQQGRLAAIVASSQDAIVGSSFDGVITAWNQAASLMFGHTEREALGHPLSLIVGTDEQAELEQVYEQLKRGERVAPFETVRLTQDGSPVSVSIAVSAIRDAAARPIGASEIFRDITELKRAQEILQREAHEKDQFLAVLSHELRNPLAPLRTTLEILRSQPASALLERSLGIMDRQLSQLISLVDQLLDAARISKGKIVLDPEDLDLVGLVRGVIEDHRRVFEQAGLEIESSLADRPVYVKGDRLRIAQSLGNLLGNSARFTQPGGTIGVGVAREPDGRHATITVTDTGRGIEPSALARLFQPFVQGAAQGGETPHAGEGLGLGLWLVKALAESHGGSVEARSRGPGQGTEVTIRLPLLGRSRPTLDRKHEGPEQTPHSTPRRILIVEDNEDAAYSLRRLLEIQGHNVQSAATGREGVELAQAFRPEVVLCDIQLRGDMDGYAVAAALRGDLDGSLYLVALTGYGQPGDRERSRAAGFDWHLTKPPRPDELTQLLADLPRRV